MDFALDVTLWTAAGLASWHAYGVGMELFVAWYSGVDPPMTRQRWWLALAHLCLALGVAAAAGVALWAR
ncbi:MAG: hypothetical protein KAI24_06310 [Planctomycetes bacterium]|nr:hypothetical protein [Planctomycetota bacterium]